LLLCFGGEEEASGQTSFGEFLNFFSKEIDDDRRPVGLVPEPTYDQHLRFLAVFEVFPSAS
jgi:hypothetical protein